MDSTPSFPQKFTSIVVFVSTNPSQRSKNNKNQIITIILLWWLNIWRKFYCLIKHREALNESLWGLTLSTLLTMPRNFKKTTQFDQTSGNIWKWQECFEIFWKTSGIFWNIQANLEVNGLKVCMKTKIENCFQTLFPITADESLLWISDSHLTNKWSTTHPSICCLIPSSPVNRDLWTPAVKVEIHQIQEEEEDKEDEFQLLTEKERCSVWQLFET